ncbi:hypothetical protein SAMN06264365_104510 [Actinoplanes regularis]|uniref:Uncharacterized protein n=1 Tax=Actinoplanes regularis TaxID=52697 RepID=A0A238YFB5_9ACTN|nr:hypothetical protein Are01nite_24190 [Actinoplanes regularis]SNR69750.1 hypothetical protein SAMN06264365_104510 [Actinoplanes regularis]
MPTVLVVENAAYTSAWYVRHPDGALSAVSDLRADDTATRRPGTGPRATDVAGKKVVAEGPE